MSWLWWLLAPIAVTILGSVLVALHGIGRPRRPFAGRPDPIAEHAAFLDALPRPTGEYPVPATVVIFEPAELEG